MSEKIKSYIDTFHEHGIYPPRRTVSITGEIDIEQYEQVAKNLHALDGTTGAINVIINSEGGDVQQAKAIYDLIKGCKNYVRGMVYGECYSSAVLILMSCDERLMSPNSDLMIHIGEESSPSDHPENKARWDAKHKRDGDWIEDILLKKIKQKKKRFTRAQLKSILRFDTIYTPKEALEMGLIDGIEEKFE